MRTDFTELRPNAGGMTIWRSTSRGGGLLPGAEWSGLAEGLKTYGDVSDTGTDFRRR
ncbi:MAG: hypothetical protein HN919_14805 [Verrucomicrobia bacterium]|nr:hypothetical protein [Verrucomicrobiota bacterium]